MKMNSRGWFHNAVIFIICISLAGCGPQWKRKFVRKRAAEKPEQVFVYEPKEYKREPNSELYKRNFIFWKSWQEELVNKLGDNKTADLRSFEEALKNLDEMGGCLVEQKAAELREYRKKLEAFYNTYKSGDFDIVQSKWMRQDLNRLMLQIDKKFRYNRVKDAIK